MFADVAQQVEHFLGKEEASSSNLPISSITPQTCSVVFLFVLLIYLRMRSVAFATSLLGNSSKL